METTLNPVKNSKIFSGMILCLLLLILWEVVTKILIKTWFPALTFSSQVLISRLLFWLYLFGLWFFAFKTEKLPLLLWPNKAYPVKFYLASVCLLLLATFIGSALLVLIIKLLHLLKQSGMTKSLLGLDIPLKLLIVLTAAVCEELIFRGYLMPRLQLYFKSKWWPIIISALIFGLGHASYGTLNNVIGPLYIGLVFGWYYQRYRNLPALIICHFIVDFIGLILAKGVK